MAVEEWSHCTRGSRYISLGKLCVKGNASTDNLDTKNKCAKNIIILYKKASWKGSLVKRKPLTQQPINLGMPAHPLVRRFWGDRRWALPLVELGCDLLCHFLGALSHSLQEGESLVQIQQLCAHVQLLLRLSPLVVRPD